jgi:hypothetical protein
MQSSTAFARLKTRKIFDIPVKCNSCGYIGCFQVYKGENSVDPVSGVPLDAGPAFKEALNALNDQGMKSLEAVRSRAEKVASTTTALTSLFGIGSVLTSIDSMPDIEQSYRIGIACLLLLGLVCLTASTYFLFPTSLVITNVDNLYKFNDNLQSERATRALNELLYLELSKVLTLFGLLLISVATALSWFAPRTGT